MTFARSTIKSLIGAVLALGVVAAVAAGGLTVFEQTTGADPRDAFNVVPQLPVGDEDLTRWLEDDDDLDREVEPATRALVESAWVRGWSRLSIVGTTGDPADLRTWFTGPAYDDTLLAATSGAVVSIDQHAHDLHVTFYSVDGSVLGVEATSELTRTVDGRSTRSIDTYEVQMLLSDGNWRVHQLTRIASELRNT